MRRAYNFKEWQSILKNNNLPAMEMNLPPGNKILR